MLHTDPVTPARRNPRRTVAFDLCATPDDVHPDDADAMHGDGVLVEFELTTDPADPTAC